MPSSPQAAWLAMQRSVRNLGREGLAATAISAVDAAIHDLKARLLGLPQFKMLGGYRDNVPIYGSGGFTTYSDRELQVQLGGWVEREGCSLVKMKVGSQPEKDSGRVKAAKQAIGDRATLFVDANGAYRVQQALEFANEFAEQRVGWFEEPVSSDDLAGLRATRKRAPAGMEIAAGEYAYSADYVRENAGGAGGRRAAGRYYPLRRRNRLSADRCPLRGLSYRPFRALRAFAAFARGLRVAAAAASGMVSRSRPD